MLNNNDNESKQDDGEIEVISTKPINPDMSNGEVEMI